MPVLQFRFADKFGKLSAGAKRRNSKQNYRRRGGACSRTIWADLCANRFVCRRSMVWTLQGTQQRMVGQRTIQLRVVRSIFRALPFLAPVAGQAAGPNFKSKIPNRMFSSACDGNCRAALTASGSTF